MTMFAQLEQTDDDGAELWLTAATRLSLDGPTKRVHLANLTRQHGDLWSVQPVAPAFQLWWKQAVAAEAKPLDEVTQMGQDFVAYLGSLLSCLYAQT